MENGKWKMGNKTKRTTRIEVEAVQPVMKTCLKPFYVGSVLDLAPAML